MTNTSHPRRRRLAVLLTAALIVLAALVGIGVYGLALAPSPSAHDAASAPPTPAHPSAAPEPTAPPAALPAIRSTSDAKTFAREAAKALINWDSAAEFGPTDYAQVVVDAGDPTGTETAGLASDVRAYLPTPDAWSTLRTYGTRQWLTIDHLFIPTSWNEALGQATQGQLLPGTIAYTVTGTRHRSGTVGTQPQVTSRPIAFTLFIACEPSFDVCRLLRLSEVDNPLR